MKLDFEAIKSLTVGAVFVSKRDDGVMEFNKCSKRQIEAWHKFGDAVLAMRAKTTTGVRIDFHTNSGFLAFKTSSGAKFELLIDGKIRERFVSDSAGSINARVELRDPRGDKKEDIRVTLVFPSHSIGSLEYIEIDDGAYAIAHEYERSILFIGDSITQGYNSYYDSLSFAWRVTKYYDAKSVINGIGGAFYQPETFDKVDFDPDTVIIAYGTNDAMRFSKISDMQNRVSGYLDLVKESYGNKRVIVISPIWRADSEGRPCNSDFAEKRLMVEKEAKDRGFEVICGLDLVDPIKEYFADTYLHPNDLGFAAYAENLIKIMESNERKNRNG